MKDWFQKERRIKVENRGSVKRNEREKKKGKDMYYFTDEMKRKYFDPDGEYLKENLTTDEWIDFLKDYDANNENPLGTKDNSILGLIMNPETNYHFI